MLKKIIPIAVLGTAFVGLNACKNDSFKKTKDGLEYKIIKDEKGDKKPGVGDIVEMHIHIHYSDAKQKDTTLFDSRKMNNNIAVEFPVMPPAFKGDWPEGIMLLTAGDSATFRVSVDSVMKMSQGEFPAFMKKGEKITYDVVMVSIKSKAEVEKSQMEQAGKQKDVDEAKLQAYMTENGIKATRTNSGLYYIIDKEGTGATAQAGQTVTVNYTGKTLDGKPFDSNVDPQFQHVEPFKFALGQGQVIPGWDEGVQLLKKGSKARLFIPSTLAYGPSSPGPGIDANAILLFDVEVTGIN